ncbi:MAG TPA: SRPBCC family protein, partial [Mycobacterium sp.]
RFLPLQMRLVEEGAEARQGVGAVHQMGLGPIGVKERITELVPRERIAYELIAGAPVRRHVGEIVFADEGAGTRVTYRMDSTPSLPVPSGLLVLVLRGLTTVMVRGAAREACRQAGARYPDSGSMSPVVD